MFCEVAEGVSRRAMAALWMLVMVFLTGQNLVQVMAASTGEYFLHVILSVLFHCGVFLGEYLFVRRR